MKGVQAAGDTSSSAGSSSKSWKFIIFPFLWTILTFPDLDPQTKSETLSQTKYINGNNKIIIKEESRIGRSPERIQDIVSGQINHSPGSLGNPLSSVQQGKHSQSGTCIMQH